VEIYPRALTGPVVKRDPAARRTYLEARYPELPAQLRDLAVASEDAFDAAVSALVMSGHEAALRSLPALDEPVALREGWVWIPSETTCLTPTAPPAATG
jgi:hypothetical protein